LGLRIVGKLAKQGHRTIAIARKESSELTALMQVLLSDGAKNITGTVLTVDAGNTA
jgi:NAD(P)-dependent dehydrogenase (short-subunit alcohol dehydrogenase family)